MKLYANNLFITIFGHLFALLLLACSSVNLHAVQNPIPVDQPKIGNHPPAIIRVETREKVINGFKYLYKDVYFKDSEGDATEITYQIVSSSLNYPLNFTNDPINISPENQKSEALISVPFKYWRKVELTFEIRIRDKAGNLSEPILFQISSNNPPVIDKNSILLKWLSQVLPITIGLILIFWLLFRKKPDERLPALRSTLLLLCLFLLFRFVGLIFHEGGHSLYLVYRGIDSISLYIHPFLFAGYSRPVIDSSIWEDILGSIIALPLALLITLPFWKRRSTALLPLVMLFPCIAALQDGPNILPLIGDFSNMIQKTHLSPIPFFFLGAFIIIIGLILMFGLLPLLGLDPKNKRSLFVFPAAVLLQSIISFVVAYFIVPGSPIDSEYFLGQEIMTGMISLVGGIIFWVILALLYITLYRKFSPKLPAWLRTETVELTWNNLKIPALLAISVVVIGIIIIT